MKKILFASTALVAFAVAGAAQAADPIALKLGGYSTWVFGYADNDEDTIVGPGGDVQSLDVKGTNEVYFLGSTTLDNGLKIGVQMELEAGGQPETQSALGGTDVIDEAYITVDGGFGRVILGSENNGAYLLHVAAPAAVGTFYGEGEVGERRWILNPAGVTSQLTTAINTDSDAEKITYVAPSFAGLTLGASYIPSLDNTNGDNPNQPVSVGATLTDVVGFAAAYNNSFAGFGLRLSAGYVTVLDTLAPAVVDDHQEVSFGGQVGYAGFTVGGSARFIDQDASVGAVDFDTAADGYIWDAGVQYATGPFAVSFTYQTGTFEGAGVIATAEDEKEVFLVTGRYNMGPGVDLIAGAGHTAYELNGVDSNEGFWAATGLSLAF